LDDVIAINQRRVAVFDVSAFVAQPLNVVVNRCAICRCCGRGCCVIVAAVVAATSNIVVIAVVVAAAAYSFRRRRAL